MRSNPDPSGRRNGDEQSQPDASADRGRPGRWVSEEDASDLRQGGRVVLPGGDIRSKEGAGTQERTRFRVAQPGTGGSPTGGSVPVAAGRPTGGSRLLLFLPATEVGRPDGYARVPRARPREVARHSPKGCAQRVEAASRPGSEGTD